MKPSAYKLPKQLLTALILSLALIIPTAHAATDGTHNLYPVQTAWDGTAQDRTTAPTADYDYSYGDEGSVTYTLPWSFTFYGTAYTQITADTNGNIWFAATDSAHSFNLADTGGRGPVIAAWNADLSSYFYGGVFIQHKTDPERVVVEWLSETYTEESTHIPNRFETILYQNGSIRIDYAAIAGTTAEDFGSGISKGDNTAYINLTTQYGSPFAQTDSSYGVGLTTDPDLTIDTPTSPETATTTITGKLQVGSTIEIATSATVGAITYPSPTTWAAVIYNLPEGDTDITVSATLPGGTQVTDNTTVNFTPGGKSTPVPAIGPVALFVALVILLILSNKVIAQGRRDAERAV